MAHEHHAIPEPFNIDDPPEITSQLSGLVAAAHAVGLQDHKRLLEMNARNVERSWRMGMDALGWVDDRPKEEDDDMGGDVKVAGDTHNHYVINQTPHDEPKAPPVTPKPPPTTNGNNKWWLPWALAAGITGANVAGGAWLLNNLPQPVVNQPDTRTTIGLETE